MHTRKISITLLVLFIIMGFVRWLHFFKSQSIEDNNIKETFAWYTSSIVEVHNYTIQEQPIRYIELGNRAGPSLVFIHGAPWGISTWSNMIELTNLAQDYRIFIVDRPWYGKSYNWHAVTSLEKQAKYIQPILEKNTYPSKPILIGHSFWWPVVTQLLIDYPTEIWGWIVIAGAVDPDHEIIWKISYPMELPIINSLISQSLRVTNKEKLSHVAELTIMKPLLKNITQPLTIMHGYDDWIVPVENAFYLEAQAENAQIDMRVRKEWSHLIPFKFTPDVVQAINDMQITLYP